MNSNQATFAVVVLSLSAIGFGLLDSELQAQTEIHAEPSTPEVRHQPTVSPSPTQVIVLPTVEIRGDRPKTAAKAKAAPCKARDEGTRDLDQGSGSVHTWTFCSR